MAAPMEESVVSRVLYALGTIETPLIIFDLFIHQERRGRALGDREINVSAYAPTGVRE